MAPTATPFVGVSASRVLALELRLPATIVLRGTTMCFACPSGLATSSYAFRALTVSAGAATTFRRSPMIDRLATLARARRLPASGHALRRLAMPTHTASRARPLRRLSLALPTTLARRLEGDRVVTTLACPRRLPSRRHTLRALAMSLARCASRLTHRKHMSLTVSSLFPRPYKADPLLLEATMPATSFGEIPKSDDASLSLRELATAATTTTF
jgi:hypothetical protein